MKWFWRKRSELVGPVVIGTSEGGGELDVFSPTWVFVTKHLESEINRLRERNDSIALSAEQTAVIRGEIRALIRLVKLPEELNRKTGFVMNPPE